MYEKGLCHSGRHLASFGLFVLGLLVFTGHNASAQTNVTLAWDASTDASVTGYKVYYGVATGVYTNWVDAGGATNVTVYSLATGMRYFFAATAIDNLGQESVYSAETNYVTPGGPPNHAPTISGISDQFVTMDTPTAPLVFTISDQETPAASLSVSASSGNSSVVAQSGLALGGSGANRTITVTPVSGANGSAQITVVVSDGLASASTSFQITVSGSRPPGYTAAAATYNGLFYESSQVELPSAGAFKLTTTTKSTYSGQVRLQGKTYSVSGKLNTSGQGSNSIARTGLNPLVFLFDCGSSNDVVIGTISSSGWLASVSGDRLRFNSKTNPAPWAGSYTLVLPGQDGSDLPRGHSFGSVKVNTVMPSAWTRMTGGIPPGDFRDTVEKYFPPEAAAPVLMPLAPTEVAVPAPSGIADRQVLDRQLLSAHRVTHYA